MEREIKQLIVNQLIQDYINIVKQGSINKLGVKSIIKVMRSKKLYHQTYLQPIVQTSVSPPKQNLRASKKGRILFNPQILIPIGDSKLSHTQTQSNNSNSNMTKSSSNSSISHIYKYKISNKGVEKEVIVNQIEKRRYQLRQPLKAWESRKYSSQTVEQTKSSNNNNTPSSQIDNIILKICKLCLNFAVHKPNHAQTHNLKCPQFTVKSENKIVNQHEEKQKPNQKANIHIKIDNNSSNMNNSLRNKNILEILMLQAKGYRKQAIFKTFQWILTWIRSIFILFSSSISKKYQGL